LTYIRVIQDADMAGQASRIDSLRPDQWQEDLRALAAQIVARHRNPFHHVSKIVFDDAVATLDRRIPTARDHEIIVGLQSIAAMIGDGHTRLEVSGRYHYFPLEFFWFGGQPRVIRTIGGYERVLGTRLVSIGDYELAVVLDRLDALIPQAENYWFVLHQRARHVVCAEALAALGMLTEVGAARFAFARDDGASIVLELQAVPSDAHCDWLDPWLDAPLHRRRPDVAFWSTYLPDTRAVYAAFRRYDDLGDHARRLWEQVDANPVDRLVIDMRHNSGGNYVLGREHLVYPAHSRQSVNRTGRLFVITGRQTFSAAMTNATDFRRETEAILVGEPPGARPNGYQELSRFTLPNSRLEGSCSSLRYRFQDGDAPFVMPDKRIDPEWESYRAGRDSVMDWILRGSSPTASPSFDTSTSP
jgi:hypothetical protein